MTTGYVDDEMAKINRMEQISADLGDERDRIARLEELLASARGTSDRRAREAQALAGFWRCPAVLQALMAEVDRARKRGDFHNKHETYAVLLEEVEEFWESVKKDRPDFVELLQVAAVAIRALDQWATEDRACAAYMATRNTVYERILTETALAESVAMAMDPRDPRSRQVEREIERLHASIHDYSDKVDLRQERDAASERAEQLAGMLASAEQQVTDLERQLREARANSLNYQGDDLERLAAIAAQNETDAALADEG